MDLVRGLSSLNKDDMALAGGKGASLGEMTQAGLSVPPGFVVLTKAFDRFLEEAGLKTEIRAGLASVRQEEMQGIESFSAKIQELIRSAEMPQDMAGEILRHFEDLNCKLVAVRSSATAEDAADAAWAGQLDTYLNTNRAALLEKIRCCWASLFNTRAIFYRLEKNFSKDNISVAVVVQKMVASDISGIAFSVHPVTQDHRHMVIEAAPGLGDAIVSGRITPDNYVVDKGSMKILGKSVIGATQALTDEKASELAGIILKIEAHYGFPCDVEWALEKDTFYVLQSRPITTLRG